MLWTITKAMKLRRQLIFVERKELSTHRLDFWKVLDKADSVQHARAAKLGGELLKQIETDAEIPAFCKAVFKKYLPRVLAKYLNEAGASAKYKEEGALVLGMLYYVYDKACRRREIKKLAIQAATQGT